MYKLLSVLSIVLLSYVLHSLCTKLIIRTVVYLHSDSIEPKQKRYDDDTYASDVREKTRAANRAGVDKNPYKY